MDKILLCENSPYYAIAISQALKTQKYQIDLAPDGQIALEKLQSNNDYNLILCNIDLPVLNGFEVIKQMKNNQFNKNAKFIFLTSEADMKTINRCLQLGATDYLIKSQIFTDKLLTLVKKYLGSLS